MNLEFSCFQYISLLVHLPETLKSSQVVLLLNSLYHSLWMKVKLKILNCREFQTVRIDAFIVEQ